MKWEIEAAIERYLDHKMEVIIAENGKDKTYANGWLGSLAIETSGKRIEQFKSDILTVVKKKIEERGQFMLLCKNGKTPPIFIHQNYESAKKEAARLQRKFKTDVKILLIYDEECMLPF